MENISSGINITISTSVLTFLAISWLCSDRVNRLSLVRSRVSGNRSSSTPTTTLNSTTAAITTTDIAVAMVPYRSLR